MKTLAAVLTKINNDLRIEELTLPELRPGQVLTQVAFSGLCHSQLNEIQGLKGKDKYLPHTLGHEGSGIVEAIGDGVKKVKPGDHVVLTWIKGTGADIPSASYTRRDGTVVNSGAIATFLTKAVISENRVVKIPTAMPLDLAALLGCAISTGMGTVKNIAKTKKGDSLAVFGIGGVGLAAVHAASILGAALVIAIDVKATKLKNAKELGATHLIDASHSKIADAIMEITHGKGVDYAIECAGIADSMETAFCCVRNHGGQAIIVGNLPKDAKITIDPFMLINGKGIVGSWGGATDPDIDIPFYVQLFLEGKLKLDKMLTHRFPFQNINEAFIKLAKGAMGRGVIKF